MNFNAHLEDYNEEITEKVLNEIAYSVFDSYDVNMVNFEINSKKLKYISR